jgi:hypothetical protein
MFRLDRVKAAPVHYDVLHRIPMLGPLASAEAPKQCLDTVSDVRSLTTGDLLDEP